MTEDPVPPVRRSATTMWLVASIAGNLFLAGLVVGSLFSARNNAGPMPRPPLQMMVSEASGRVSPEGLQKLSQLADELEARFRGSMSDSVAIRDKIRAQLREDRFDAAAFTGALDELNTALARDRGAANKRFAEVIATLSPADRKQLASIRFP